MLGHERTSRLGRGARRWLRGVALVTATVLLLASTTVGAALAVQWYGDRSPGPRAADAAAPDAAAPDAATSEGTAPEVAAPEPTADPEPEPEPWQLARGARGVEVRELQHRLFQLAWWPERTTGRYDADVAAAVRGFQAKRGLPATGVVDEATWRRLVRMTEEPTRDQLHNVLHPGPVLLGAGARGEKVRDLQHRLVQTQWLAGEVTGRYDAATVAAVRGFQAKRRIPVTGAVDQRTLDRLVAMTYEPTYDQRHNIEPQPGALDPRCRQGRVLCVDKSSRTLRWVVGGKVVTSFDVRFGSDELPTREGSFTVGSKSPDHVSSLYGTSMPFAMFFSGGQAVHYSPDFAAHGYAGASHGCVNVRDYAGITWLFGQVRVGDRVVVYWS
jgi:peptidoglycan hydrolase-like protein with peptidoglycan-binding domain